MREIKFRVWDTKHSRFGVENYYQDAMMIGADDILEPDNCLERYVWLQYTGIYDVEGMEIYEGDLVYYGYIGLCVVVFNEGCFRLKVISTTKKDVNKDKLRNFEDYSKGAFLIQGNIYENKSMLEEAA